MKLKICGLKDKQNIQDVLYYMPDFIGFNFYEKSPRYVEGLNPSFVRNLKGVIKVGVFVNARLDDIVTTVEYYGLNMVQLHGEESLTTVQKLKKKGISIIKVFRVLDQLPTEIDDFAPYCDLLLFDTRTKQYGGSGQHFDWSILKQVDYSFLLGGGIGFDDLQTINDLNLKHLIGLDINSKVEVRPGIKDIKKIKEVRELV